MMYQHEDSYTAWANETLKSELYIPESKFTSLVENFDLLPKKEEETNEA